MKSLRQLFFETLGEELGMIFIPRRPYHWIAIALFSYLILVWMILSAFGIPLTRSWPIFLLIVVPCILVFAYILYLCTMNLLRPQSQRYSAWKIFRSTHVNLWWIRGFLICSIIACIGAIAAWIWAFLHLPIK